MLSKAAHAGGGVPRNTDGEPFTERCAPKHKGLAVRDVVPRSVAVEIDVGHDAINPKDPDGPKDCIWLDMTDVDPECMKEVLPQVAGTIE